MLVTGNSEETQIKEYEYQAAPRLVVDMKSRVANQRRLLIIWGRGCPSG